MSRWALMGVWSSPPGSGRRSRMERGGAFVASVENGAIKLEPLDQVIRRVQANVRRYVPDGNDLAAELSEDRRREAELE